MIKLTRAEDNFLNKTFYEMMSERLKYSRYEKNKYPQFPYPCIEIDDDMHLTDKKYVYIQFNLSTFFLNSIEGDSVVNWMRDIFKKHKLKIKILGGYQKFDIFGRPDYYHVNIQFKVSELPKVLNTKFEYNY